MNDNFIGKQNKSGLSIYALSRASGVPYTTVNEIKNCKTSINKCSLQTVYRLAAALGAEPEEIVDKILYLDGVEGVYNGIRYRWSCDGNITKLHFTYDNEDITLGMGTLFNIPSRFAMYKIIAGWRIQEYVDEINWKRHAGEVWGAKDDK